MIIFVEGISGVGKSTAVEKLGALLARQGISSRVYLEGDDRNPIDFYCTAYFNLEEYRQLEAGAGGFKEQLTNNTFAIGPVRLVRYFRKGAFLFPEPLLSILRAHELSYNPKVPVSVEEYMRVSQALWKSFAASPCEKAEVMLFDGSLLHHPINDLMRNYGASLSQIAAHINGLAEAVKAYQPEVLYLLSSNVEERLCRAHMSRGQTAPTHGQIRFWEKRREIDLAVMEGLPTPCHQKDISEENWDAILEAFVRDMVPKAFVAGQI